MSRASLYYVSKQTQKDWSLKRRVEDVLAQHPSYGYRRMALALHVNKKRTQRVMRRFGLHAYRRRGRKWRKPKDKSLIIYPNLLRQTIPRHPGHVQESFYSHFKVELGDPNRFRSLGELVYEIYKTIHTYNTTRIHSALRMAPRTFLRQREMASENVSYVWVS